MEVRLVLQSQPLQIDNEPGQITRRISHVELVKIYNRRARALKEYVSRHIAAMSRTEPQRARGRGYSFESMNHLVEQRVKRGQVGYRFSNRELGPRAKSCVIDDLHGIKHVLSIVKMTLA